jgi:hypothetical protein
MKRCLPSLNAYSRTGPRFDSASPSLPRAAKQSRPDPHPTAVITYCSPFGANVTGTESIADLVLTDHTFFPLSAAYAANSPVPCPWKTRLPAVESTPPFTAISSSTDHRADWLTGSHAISRPNNPSAPSPASAGAFASARRSVVGMYTNPVSEL